MNKIKMLFALLTASSIIYSSSDDQLTARPKSPAILPRSSGHQPSFGFSAEDVLDAMAQRQIAFTALSTKVAELEATNRQITVQLIQGHTAIENALVATTAATEASTFLAHEIERKNLTIAQMMALAIEAECERERAEIEYKFSIETLRERVALEVSLVRIKNQQIAAAAAAHQSTRQELCTQTARADAAAEAITREQKKASDDLKLMMQKHSVANLQRNIAIAVAAVAGALHFPQVQGAIKAACAGVICRFHALKKE